MAKVRMPRSELSPDLEPPAHALDDFVGVANRVGNTYVNQAQPRIHDPHPP